MSVALESASPARRRVESLLARADIRVGGSRPFDVQVLDERFFERVLRDGQMGFGESWMDGWWTCEAADEMTARFIRAGLHKPSLRDAGHAVYALRLRLAGLGRKGKAFEVGRRHYDLGNDLFRAMLDPRMVYSCAYWKDADDLDAAQEAKLDLVCRKLDLRPGQRVLEIGCGWGGWARFAAERYGVEVVGLTVSGEQARLAREVCAGLPVEIRLQDYRDAAESYDRVVSIAMLEAVGRRHYGVFLDVIERSLKPEGLALVHSIFGNEPVPASEAPWLNEYVFPNGELPSLGQFLRASEGRFVVEALHHLDGQYEPTLAAWRTRFEAAWPALSDRYDARFHRMWTLYLLMAKGIFMSRKCHVWQVVLSRNGARPGAPAFAPDPGAYDAR